jgi:Do/DeqQ family serine protease
MSLNWKNVLAIVAISAGTTIVSIWGYGKFVQADTSSGSQATNQLPVNYAGFTNTGGNNGSSVDFTPAATTATPAVVHIKTRTKARQATVQEQRRPRNNPFFDFFGDDLGDFFGGGPRVIPEQRASGSGVIITQDGYIVTNNHVINEADEINVTLANKKTYKATLVGADASTDLAVIKIEGKGLPYLIYGNSDDTKLGQWVLAIGYPLSLDVTVTAGIVSAKARSIGVNDRQSTTAIESFIQTDAAVNPGNSGGALVNTAGELIGINSAIASPTGSYAGYSYAIPVNIVKKVVTDLVKFGTVQRAFIGIQYNREGVEIPEEEKKNIPGYKEGEGVYVTDVPAEGAAAQAGIKKGDIVTKLNGVSVTTGPELQEQIARYKPGDKISLTYQRGGKENTVPIVLRNKSGNTEIVKNNTLLDKLGAEFSTVDAKTAAANRISGGVVVRKIKDGILRKRTRLEEGFIITKVNNQEVKTIADFERVLNSNKGKTVIMECVYPGAEGIYPIPLNLSDLGNDE